MSGRNAVELASFADPVVCCLCAFLSKLTVTQLFVCIVRSFSLMSESTLISNQGNEIFVLIQRYHNKIVMLLKLKWD